MGATATKAIPDAIPDTARVPHNVPRVRMGEDLWDVLRPRRASPLPCQQERYVFTVADDRYEIWRPEGSNPTGYWYVGLRDDPYFRWCGTAARRDYYNLGIGANRLTRDTVTLLVTMQRVKRRIGAGDEPDRVQEEWADANERQH